MTPRSVFLLAFLTLFAAPSALAQVEMGDDLLYAGMHLGATPAAVDSIHEIGDWIKGRRNATEAKYSRGDKHSGETRTITFKDGQISSIDATVTVAKSSLEIAATVFEGMKQMLAARADRTEKKGSTTTYTHTASDGRQIRTVWKQTGRAKVRLIVTVL